MRTYIASRCAKMRDRYFRLFFKRLWVLQNDEDGHLNLSAKSKPRLGDK